MATPSDVPISTTRGRPFLPGKLDEVQPKQPELVHRYQRTEDRRDHWGRKGKHRGQR